MAAAHSFLISQPFSPPLLSSRLVEKIAADANAGEELVGEDRSRPNPQFDLNLAVVLARFMFEAYSSPPACDIDGNVQGEGEDEDENGEIGEEDEERLEDNRVYEEGNDDDADDEDEETEYLVQPISPPQAMVIGSDLDIADPNDVDEDRDEVDDDEEVGTDQPSSSQGNKRKRDDDPSGSGSDDEDDGVEALRPLKHMTTAALSSPLSCLHSDTNGFHAAAVSQLSNPSTRKVVSDTQQGIMNYNNKLSPEDFVEGQIWAVFRK